jgi:aspartyl protease family protein
MKVFWVILIGILLLPGCKSCSHSGSRAISEQAGEQRYATPKKTKGNVVKMRRSGGVYFVPIMVNGVPMEFIFDTGASTISISATEALFLYKQGQLHDDDFVGTQKFVDATGRISEGTVIILRTVKIGDRMLRNVEASIVHSLEAPLLLGQSALQQFGNISIDYGREEITFR